MCDEIEVEMDGIWKSAVHPNWLTTWGVGTCIAVAAAADAAQKAWLIHAPVFGHDISPLAEMFKACKLSDNPSELRILVRGGKLVAATASEVKLARSAVTDEIRSTFPELQPDVQWGSLDCFELIFREGRWSLSTE